MAHFITQDLLKGKLLHGGDYNPDQWLAYPEKLEEDIRWMKEANVNVVSLGIFSWSMLEPREGAFTFDWLEERINTLYEHGIYTLLATPTGALPHWLSEAYEETRQMRSDGIRRLPGERHNMCPSSSVMREKMHIINTKLAQTFAEHPGVIGWHISNEYGGGGGDHGEGACYCPYCQENFRRWLKRRYTTLEALNEAWWTGFWSNRFSDWSEIHSPSRIGEGSMHGLKLDWKRFASDQMLDFCKDEIAVIREYSSKPVTTNFMLSYYSNYDYAKWAKALDVVSLDSYPEWHRTLSEREVADDAAMQYDIARSFRRAPFLLMESTPSLVNWKPVSRLKRPGMHELSSLQAIAHGSDSVQYFQWRKSRGNYEKFHGAVIDHKNGNDTRVFRDVARLGKRLDLLSEVISGSCNRPKVAVIFDRENLWAAEDAAGAQNPMDYTAWVRRYYSAIIRWGIDIDVVDMDADLKGYELVVAPLNYMYRGDYAQRVRRFVAEGGTYVTTCWSGEVNESDLCFLDEHPLRDVLGIRTEEIDVAMPELHNTVSYESVAYETTGLCALVHAETAEILARYDNDFYQGYPAWTKNHYGKGTAHFVAFEAAQAFADRCMEDVLRESGISCELEVDITEGVHISSRETEDKRKVWFVQNFNREAAVLTFQRAYQNLETGEILTPGEHEIAGYTCLILAEIGAYAPLTEEVLLGRLSKSREHSKQGLRRDAEQVCTELKTKCNIQN